ncbi:MAG: CHAD domain-containing protein [Chloroflexia bacterium]|nr:CHAD domain-containing protein [Chloroflexia bacterium]
MSGPPSQELSTKERALLDYIANEGRPVYARRARLLLLWGQGLKIGEIASQVQLSPGRVRYWLRAFARKRWHIFPQDLIQTPEPSASDPGSSPEGVPPEPPSRPGLEPEDSMLQAAGKILSLYFRRMLQHERGTRLGQDMEELHDMRVATRRMRAALRMFGPYVQGKAFRPIRRGLRRTGDALGAVRDLDVFWLKTEQYLAGLSAERQGDLDLLRQAWEVEYEQRRQEMLAYLDGKRYARFKERFDDLLRSPQRAARPLFSDKGEARPRRLSDLLPVLVSERLAQVLAYDEWVMAEDMPLGQLHRLRIAAKRLRYALEFFQELLGPEAPLLIEKLKGLQDHLGNLQDAVVASSLLCDFLAWGTWGHGPASDRGPAVSVVAPGVAAYLAARQAELQQLVESFPQVWSDFREPEFRRAIARVVFPWPE